MIIKDKVFVITGAARGLGFAIAKDIAIAGGKLALVDMNQQGLEQAITSLQRYHIEREWHHNGFCESSPAYRSPC